MAYGMPSFSLIIYNLTTVRCVFYSLHLRLCFFAPTSVRWCVCLCCRGSWSTNFLSRMKTLINLLVLFFWFVGSSNGYRKSMGNYFIGNAMVVGIHNITPFMRTAIENLVWFTRPPIEFFFLTQDFIKRIWNEWIGRKWNVMKDWRNGSYPRVSIFVGKKPWDLGLCHHHLWKCVNWDSVRLMKAQCIYNIYRFVHLKFEKKMLKK